MKCEKCKKVDGVERCKKCGTVICCTPTCRSSLVAFVCVDCDTLSKPGRRNYSPLNIERIELTLIALQENGQTHHPEYNAYCHLFDALKEIERLEELLR